MPRGNQFLPESHQNLTRLFEDQKRRAQESEEWIGWEKICVTGWGSCVSNNSTTTATLRCHARHLRSAWPTENLGDPQGNLSQDFLNIVMRQNQDIEIYYSPEIYSPWWILWIALFVRHQAELPPHFLIKAGLHTRSSSCPWISLGMKRLPAILARTLRKPGSYRDAK